MALFPWEDWFYHVSEKEADLANLYSTYIDQKAQIITKGQVYDKNFKELQDLMIWNYALLILAHQSNMTEIDFNKFWKGVKDLPSPGKYNATAFQVIEGVSEVVGMVAFGKVVYNVTSPYIKSAFSAVRAWVKSSGTEAIEESTDLGAEALEQPLLDAASEASAEVATDMGLDAVGLESVESIAQAGVESGVELGSEAAIAATETAVVEGSAVALGTVVAGAAIFVAVGLDAIMGAVQGAKESEEIDKQKTAIQSALDTVKKYLDRLEAKNKEIEGNIVLMMDLFKVNIVTLQNLTMPLKSPFDPKTPSTLENYKKFKPAMQSAVSQFGYLGVIRQNWQNFKARSEKRHPGKPVSWDAFVDAMDSISPADMSTDLIDSMLTYSKSKLYN